MKDYSYQMELLLRRALQSNERGEYYGIDADYGYDSKGIWDMVWATLTAVQYSNPEKGEQIRIFLDENFDLKAKNETMSKWDVDRMDKFYNDLDELLKLVRN